MDIRHDPALDARSPRGTDIDIFENLQQGDSVVFFEWPVEPLTVIEREDDANVGERVRVESEGEQSFLYETNGELWHYVPEEHYSGENNPFPVQDLSLVGESDQS